MYLNPELLDHLTPTVWLLLVGTCLSLEILSGTFTMLMVAVGMSFGALAALAALAALLGCPGFAQLLVVIVAAGLACLMQERLRLARWHKGFRSPERNGHTGRP